MPTPPAPIRRDLFRSSLEVLVLSLLTAGPRHGYQLGQKLAAATGEPLGPGTLYPLLHRLEAQGWATSSPTPNPAASLNAPASAVGRRRKWYTLTCAGEARLKAAATEWQAAIARMQGLVLPALRQTVQHPSRHQT